jgi:hypothetical protein
MLIWPNVDCRSDYVGRLLSFRENIVCRIFFFLKSCCQKMTKNWEILRNQMSRIFDDPRWTPKTQLFHPPHQKPPQCSSISGSKKKSFKKITTRFPEWYVVIICCAFGRQKLSRNHDFLQTLLFWLRTWNLGRILASTNP